MRLYTKSQKISKNLKKSQKISKNLKKSQISKYIKNIYSILRFMRAIIFLHNFHFH